MKLARGNLSSGLEPDVLGTEIEIKFSQRPIRGCGHLQPGLYRFNRPQEVESQERRIPHEVSLRLRRDLLRRVTHLFSAIVNPPPLFHRLGDCGYGMEQDRSRRGPKLASQEEDVRETPEKNDGYAEKSLHNHAPKNYILEIGRAHS